MPTSKHRIAKEHVLKINLLIISLLLLTILDVSSATNLTHIKNFGENPGALKMYAYSPLGIPANSPLVVLLHGCEQNAKAFAKETGWMKFADERKFHLIFPETNSSNNPKKCFNWFEPNDIKRDSGEVKSIVEMMNWFKALKKINEKRVYISGLSAGGAMTTAMGSVYPELFEAIGVVSGISWGCATNIFSAIDCMKGNILFPNTRYNNPTLFFRNSQTWGELVRKVTNFKGTFPRASIWHGSLDSVVTVVNSNELTKQWTNLHKLSHKDFIESEVENANRRVYTDTTGKEVVEVFRVHGMEHGQAIKPGNTNTSCGTQSPYILDADICTSYHLSNFFNL
jgi:feruloyl esterase